MATYVLPVFDASGNVIDRSRKILARKEYVDAVQAALAALDASTQGSLGSLDTRVDTLENAAATGRTSLRKTFVTAAATWTWVHNLGVRPTVTMTVDGLGIVIPDVTYIDDNTLSIELDSPHTGYLDIA